MKEQHIWWKHGVIYQLYPCSFQDSNGDGIGDLQGITGCLDYLAELGFDAIWISPIFASPMKDFSYGFSNYKHPSHVWGYGLLRPPARNPQGGKFRHVWAAIDEPNAT